MGLHGDAFFIFGIEGMLWFFNTSFPNILFMHPSRHSLKE